MKVFSALTFCALILHCSCTIPNYIHICQNNDPNLADCIIKSIDKIRVRLKTGIPELSVPPMEPLSLKLLTFKTNTEGASLTTNITKIQVWGASNFKILKIVPAMPKSIKDEHVFQFEVYIPSLDVKGEYEIDSKVLLLQLKGRGPFHANCSDLRFECVLRGSVIQRQGENHLQFDRIKCDHHFGKSAILVENLFNQHPTIERAVNQVINDNADLLYDEIKPSLGEAIREQFTNIANNITMSFKYEELFPQS